MEHKIAIKTHKPLGFLAARHLGELAYARPLRCSATLNHGIMWLPQSGRRPHARTLVGSCLPSCCKLVLAYAAWMKCCFRAVERTVDVRFLSTCSRHGGAADEIIATANSEGSTLIGAPPKKKRLVSRDFCRWSVRLLPRLPRTQFPTRRRCVHVLHHAERQQRSQFIQNDQRHHTISPVSRET